MVSSATELAVLQARINQLEAKLVVADRLNVGKYEGAAPTSFLEKHGLISLIAVLSGMAVQTAGAIWWAATVTGNISNLASDNIAQAVQIEKLQTLIVQNGERLTKVQTVQENVIKILDMISRREIYKPDPNDRFPGSAPPIQDRPKE